LLGADKRSCDRQTSSRPGRIAAAIDVGDVAVGYFNTGWIPFIWICRKD
jgi:hypothetical protein